MQYEPWKTEFAKFTDASIEEMKRHSDDTHLEREWMTYIYEEDYGIMISNGNMPVLYRDESGEQKIFDTRAAAEKFQKENNISGHHDCLSFRRSFLWRRIPYRSKPFY